MTLTSPEPADPAAKLVANERFKLTAAYLNAAAAASIAVGVIAPLAAVTFSFSGSAEITPRLVVGAAGWLVASLGLHLFARYILGGLRP